MKSLKYLLGGLLLSAVNFLNAQVNVNINIGTPPAWGPAGYSDARYYYLPDLKPIMM